VSQKSPLLWLNGALVCFYLIQSCASLSKVSFKSKDSVTIRAVDWADLNGAGQILGQTPVDVDLDRLKGKVLVLTAPNRATQYWVVPYTTGKKLEATVKLEERNQGTTAAAVFPVKSYSRLLMKAFEALQSKDYNLASDLAVKMATIAPEDPASSIISGLAALQKGNKSRARGEFEKAKSLDPENGDISELLQLAR
jgi:hypothetical protein